jgi:O-methyltransferase
MFSALFRSAIRSRWKSPTQGARVGTERRLRPADRARDAAPAFNTKVRWWNNPAWLERFERHVLPDGFGGRHPHRILDRRFSLTEFAKTARSVRGSTAECGVFKGIGSALICEALRGTYQNDERHFGFDSFEGLPEVGPNDANWKRGDLTESLNTAERQLAEFPFVKLVQGWLPETLSIATDHRFRLVHIDVDIERTTLDCLSFFYPRAVPGAVFVFDDYGFHSCPGARQAVDCFLSDKPETLIELTTGQATFFKQ